VIVVEKVQLGLTTSSASFLRTRVIVTRQFSKISGVEVPYLSYSFRIKELS